MLRRQQAEAVVTARKTLVEGAVGMVEMALAQLGDRGVVTLDEERKVAMVSNLMRSNTPPDDREYWFEWQQPGRAVPIHRKGWAVLILLPLVMASCPGCRPFGCQNGLPEPIPGPFSACSLRRSVSDCS